MGFPRAEGHPLVIFTFLLPEGEMNFVFPSPFEEDKGR